jgi:hypothetical protein
LIHVYPQRPLAAAARENHTRCPREAKPPELVARGRREVQIEAEYNNVSER